MGEGEGGGEGQWNTRIAFLGSPIPVHGLEQSAGAAEPGVPFFLSASVEQEHITGEDKQCD